MKNVIIFFISILVVSPLYSQRSYGEKIKTNKDDLSFYNLRGNVKSLKTKNYRVDNSKMNPISSELIKFNFQGLIIEMVQYDSSERIESWKKMKYNGEGNLIEILNLNRSGNITSKEIYELDDEGFMKRKTTLDGNGKILEKSPLHQYQFNNQGKVISEEYNNSIGVFKVTHVYDDNGNEILKTFYQGGEVSNKYVKSYDYKGRIVKSDVYDYSSLTSSVQYKYDFSDNIIYSEFINLSGFLKVKEIVEKEYDNWNNEVSIFSESYNLDGEFLGGYSISKNYIYDNQHNYVRCTTLSSDNLPSDIEDRLIQYYH
ncbi:hypothetical protein [Flagellimonas iocasae]|uniref:YD repeat-containing protein n=1 Tax=Flagellimonas iocasae TaxID=2055905 RepID=A0ABW4XZL9_9FLAO